MVHPQDSVLQFLTQYEYIMETMIEKEYREAAKGETTNPLLWGRSQIEKQVSKFYTRSIFFKFQELLRDSTALTIDSIAKEGSQMTVQVLKRVYKEGEVTMKTYNVAANQGSETYTCSCNMFDQDGLLCPHILKVFTTFDVQHVPQKYLLHRWSEEATLKVPQHLSGPEPVFGVPETNKLRYNALCRKMIQLAADACVGPEEYMGAKEVERGVKQTKFKNPPAKDPQGRPRDKVDRKKTIVQQVKEKAIKKNKSKAKKDKAKESVCLVCHEEGHGVETCKFLSAAMHLRDTELKL
ncbi:protein FAR1-RELATED SEQUENCE 9-like [Sorghum bicolor]|uniref:protein FAR1-RELATED SEQUENCE 9-like n=1 Tax=Sorghum bicolor TaxID=4558 RepID=UPI000B425D7E|nr:protein FAR1-RELATED SEQUENCE 9-like [Sorghum bicolor]|eukprot:XP_021321357.1 protein FAR1-RELATED SEQUENCE 9-like [Sorghum bicolor]